MYSAQPAQGGHIERLIEDETAERYGEPAQHAAATRPAVPGKGKGGMSEITYRERAPECKDIRPCRICKFGLHQYPYCREMNCSCRGAHAQERYRLPMANADHELISDRADSSVRLL